MKHTCGGCDSTWTGTNMAHCGGKGSGCHTTFSSAKLFDLHRQGHVCTDPASIVYGADNGRAGEPRMKLNKHGVWVGNTERPNFWEKAAA
jgi:hypothetical protein